MKNNARKKVCVELKRCSCLSQLTLLGTMYDIDLAKRTSKSSGLQDCESDSDTDIQHCYRASCRQKEAERCSDALCLTIYFLLPIHVVLRGGSSSRGEKHVRFSGYYTVKVHLRYRPGVHAIPEALAYPDRFSTAD
jgi:hypothetical protein